MLPLFMFLGLCLSYLNSGDTNTGVCLRISPQFCLHYVTLQLEIGFGGNTYTPEIGKHYKLRVPPLKELAVKHLPAQHKL